MTTLRSASHLDYTARHTSGRIRTTSHVRAYRVDPDFSHLPTAPLVTFLTRDERVRILYKEERKTVSPEDAVAVPTPDWWYRLVRDKFPLTLPDGSYDAVQIDGEQYVAYLMENLLRATERLRQGFIVRDDDVIYRNAAEVIECLSYALIASGKNLADLDDELDDLEEEEGSYGKGIVLLPSESELAERTKRIK